MSKYLSNTFWLAGLIVALAALFYLREEYRRDPEQFSTLTTISAELTSFAKGESIDATTQLKQWAATTSSAAMEGEILRLQKEREAEQDKQTKGLQAPLLYAHPELARAHFKRRIRISLLGGQIKYLSALASNTQPVEHYWAEIRRLQAQQFAAYERLRPYGFKCTVLRLRPRFGEQRANCDQFYSARDNYLSAAQKPVPSRGGTPLPDVERAARDVLQPLEGHIQKLQADIANSWSHRLVRGIKSQLGAAARTVALCFILIGLAVLGTRLIFFYVFAPLAARLPGIRLLPLTSGAMRNASLAQAGTRDDSAISAVSQAMSQTSLQEILLHREYLQSAPMSATLSTCFLLDPRIPISLLASHLINLTRIRAAESQTIVVSPTGSDALVEIGVIEIPAGSALILKPRHLVGLRKNIADRLRITRHWRLGSLAAWLTFQIRYLAFHGPVTLIVKGQRGVRLEPVGQSRNINQAATMGFSANLDYAPARAEPLWPYLTGRQPLFNDRFSGASGYYLYEESTGVTDGRSVVGRNLRRISDAFMTLLGM